MRTSANGRPPFRSSTCRPEPPGGLDRRSPPTTIAVRDATVGPESGTIEVSWRRHARRRRRRRPSSSATSCGKIVFVPWPISVEPRQDPDAAVRRQLERRDARELDLAAAGEAGAVPGEGEADPRRDAIAAGPQRRPGTCRCRPARSARALGPRPDALELGRLRGALQDLLARRRSRAGPGRSASSSPSRYSVPSADLERRDAERLGDPVTAGPPPRTRPAARRSRGTRRSAACSCAVARAADPDVRAAIRPAGVERAARQDDRRQRAVRAAVHHDLDVLGHERAVAHDAGPVADDRRVALRRRGEVLVAVVDHPHRLAGLAAPGARRGVAMIEGYSSLPPNPPPVSAWMTTGPARRRGASARFSALWM